MAVIRTPVRPVCGLLYETGPDSFLIEELQSEALVDGISCFVAHRLTNLQSARNKSTHQASQSPYVQITIVYSCWLSGESLGRV